MPFFLFSQWILTFLSLAAVGANRLWFFVTSGVAVYPIRVEYVQGVRDARLSVRWSTASASAPMPIPADALYFTRDTANSPYHYLVYPGEVEAATSSADGSGLTDCTTLTTCSFTIQGARNGSALSIVSHVSPSSSSTIFIDHHPR